MSNLKEFKNPITTKENINELHHLLVQTCLNYIVEHKLTDIDEINFSVDGLSSSYEHNEWTPGTDSSIEVIGLEYEKWKSHNSGKEYETPVRSLIGFQC